LFQKILQALGILVKTEKAPFLFELEDGSRRWVEMSPIKRGMKIDWESALNLLGDHLPLDLQNSDRHYWFRYLTESQMLYFRYAVCMNMEDQSFSDFCKQIWALVDSTPVKRLVIDMRGNSGGSSHLLELFISELVRRPELNRRGSLFGIVDRGTFSSGTVNAAQLRQRTEIILFGEATGGKPNSYGDARDSFLPNSELMVSYSTKYLVTVDEDVDCVVPDVIVELSSRDFFAGRDPVLEAILEYPETC